MNLGTRVGKLERAAGSVGDVPVSVIFVGLSGRRVPEACESALLAADRARFPGSGVRYVTIFDGNGRCRACGDEHLDEVSNE
jgi:hypothetical protein